VRIDFPRGARPETIANAFSDLAAKTLIHVEVEKDLKLN